MGEKALLFPTGVDIRTYGEEKPGAGQIEGRWAKPTRLGLAWFLFLLLFFL